MKNLLLILFFLPLFTQAQVIVTAVGTSSAGYNGDNKPATAATLNDPYGVALDDSGNLYICDQYNARIRKVSPAYGGTITTIAGNGLSGNSGDNNLGVYARIGNVFDLAVDHRGNIYIADVTNACIRKITPSDTITTIAGTGTPGYNGDNIPAKSAQLTSPYGVAVDSMGNVYIADEFNYRIRKVDTSGIITTIAGTGVAGFSPDGSLADTSAINKLRTIKADRHGNLFFSDSNRIRRINATTGIITTIAGNGIQGFSGDGGLATAAEIAAAAIAIDSTGNLFIANDTHSCVREVDAEGVITTIAGNGIGGYSGDNGPPLLAEFSSPQGIAISNSGDIFIGDVANSRIRLITAHPIDVKNVAGIWPGIKVYPNPSGGIINFLLSAATDEQTFVTVTNIQGEKIKEFTVVTNQKKQVQLSVPPGVYFLSATIDGKAFKEKIVIQ